MRILRNLAGIFVGKLVLRAQLIPIGKLNGLKYIWTKLFVSQKEVERLNQLWPDFVKRNNEKLKSNPNESVDIHRELVSRSDGVKLDIVELKAHNTNPTEYVIYGWGRSDCYEYYLPRLATDALNLNKNIISFNFRGVAHSEGQVYSERDLISDYAFQVQRLLDKGVKPENIKCYGHSLCAAIGTFALEELIRKHKSLKFYDDRSFAELIETSVALYFKRRHSRKRIVNFATVTLVTLSVALLATIGALSMVNLLALWIVGSLSTRWDLTHRFYDKTVGWLLETTMRKTMQYGGWELKAGEAYQKIPEGNKSHTVIRAPSKDKSTLLGRRRVKLMEGHHELMHDKVILYHDSLHHSVKKASHEEKKQLKNKLREAIKKGKVQEANRLKATLMDMSNAKMTGGGHMDDPKEFVTWYKSPRAGRHLTGQERFYAFVDPKGNHENPNPKRYKVY